MCILSYVFNLIWLVDSWIENYRFLWKLCDSNDLLITSEPTNFIWLIKYFLSLFFTSSQVTKQTILESIEEISVFDSLFRIQNQFGNHTNSLSNQGLCAVGDDTEAIESLLNPSGVRK